MFVKFTSHRARQRALVFLNPKPQGFYSLTRKTTYGVYEISEKNYRRLKYKGCHGMTRLRGPYDDLCKCWTSDYPKLPD